VLKDAGLDFIDPLLRGPVRPGAGHAFPRNPTIFSRDRTGRKPPDVRGHDQQSYQNVSRETFWYDFSHLTAEKLIPVS
jgi:hypothetical protein